MEIEIANPFREVTNGKSNHAKQAKIIKWNFPIAGTWKFNTDGSSRGNPGPGGIGGILRDDNGVWECGFTGSLDHCSSIFAELSSINYALKLILKKSYKNVLIETDSQIAVNMITEEKPTTWCIRDENDPLNILINECKSLLRMTRSNICHVYREGNFCADFLAKEGVNQSTECLILDQPPSELLPFLLADLMGITYIR